MTISRPQHTAITIDVDGPVGRILLDRPEKLNPLSAVCLGELIETASWFDERADVRAVIISGAGRAFSAGADLDSFTEGQTSREDGDRGRRMIEAIERMRAVTIAAVHGHCVGGGCVLVSACDLRLAAPSTRFSIPEVDLGIPLAWGGIPRLVREIGPARTRDLVLTCRPFGPDEALAAGWINRVVADDELLDEAEALARSLAAKSAYPVRATLEAVDAASEAMLGSGTTWNDADSLLYALHDQESRDAALRYLGDRGR